MWDMTSTKELLMDISAAGSPEDLLRRILVHAQRHTGLERAIVLSRDGLPHPCFRVVLDVASSASGPRYDPEHPASTRSGGLLGELLYAGEYRILSGLSGVDCDPSSDLLANAKSLVAFPLLERRTQTGMVVMLSSVAHTCQASDLCGLAVMGALLQRANRANQLAEQLDAACHRLDAELSAAADVQRWLLPPPAPPSNNVCTAALYRTAQRSGGDYYDSGPLPDGRFGVMIADVSGHGAAAAVLMAIVRTIVHDEVDESPVAGPAQLLEYADQRLCALGLPSRGAFVTAFSGALDTTTGELRYSCAGHPPPRLICSRTQSIKSLDGARTYPLGLFEERPHRLEETVRLSPGDVVVLYSDGITEARSPTGEFFGTMGMDRALGRLPAFPTAEATVAAIEQAVTSFAGSGSPLDDQTVLAVEWMGVGRNVS